MRPLRYSINVTLDGCCDHRAMFADEDLHRHAVENLNQADALLFGRVTYEMMEAAFRPPARTGARPDWMEPFARTIDAAKKYVVSSTLDRVDWNAELVRGDLGKAVQQLKREPGKGLFVGGVTVPLALADLGLIDEYLFVVQPIVAGHGPTLFAGLSERQLRPLRPGDHLVRHRRRRLVRVRRPAGWHLHRPVQSPPRAGRCRSRRAPRPRRTITITINVDNAAFEDAGGGEVARILRERGRVTDFESQVRRKDGTYRWVEDRQRLVRAPDGGPGYSRAYLRHLDRCNEMLAPILKSFGPALSPLPSIR